jgi:hypothetical protein
MVLKISALVVSGCGRKIFVLAMCSLQLAKASSAATLVQQEKKTRQMYSGAALSLQWLVSPTHKRTEGRAPVWGSEFTSKRRRTTGGIQQKPL